jgi:hypothetical protein
MAEGVSERRGSRMNIETVTEQADERIRAARADLRDPTETAMHPALGRCQAMELHEEPMRSATDVPR